MNYLINHFKKAIYLLFMIGVGLAQAGAFEDFFRAIKNDDAGTVQALLGQGYQNLGRKTK